MVGPVDFCLTLSFHYCYVKSIITLSHLLFWSGTGTTFLVRCRFFFLRVKTRSGSGGHACTMFQYLRCVSLMRSASLITAFVPAFQYAFLNSQHDSPMESRYHVQYKCTLLVGMDHQEGASDGKVSNMNSVALWTTWPCTESKIRFFKLLNATNTYSDEAYCLFEIRLRPCVREPC